MSEQMRQSDEQDQVRADESPARGALGEGEPASDAEEILDVAEDEDADAAEDDEAEGDDEDDDEDADDEDEDEDDDEEDEDEEDEDEDATAEPTDGTE